MVLSPILLIIICKRHKFANVNFEELFSNPRAKMKQNRNYRNEAKNVY